MESQPQNPEFRINPDNFHPWNQHIYLLQSICQGLDQPAHPYCHMRAMATYTHNERT